MDEYYNNHYIRIRQDGAITDGWSDGPWAGYRTPTAEDILLTDKGGYQFRLVHDGEENPALTDLDGIPLYKWDGTAVQRRTEEEIAAERAAIPAPPPTQSERFEAQLTYTAIMTDTLLTGEDE